MTRSIRTMVRKDEFVTVTRATGVVAAVAAVGLATAACGSDDATASDATQSTGAATSATGAAGGSGEYKSGTYSATGHYVSPGGPQQIGVTVTLDNATITKVDLDRSHTRGTSAEFQAKFAGGINSEVVGKNIDDLDVHKVSGSSLTSGGFNDAIAQIKSQARA
ncbi:FMN-binding protein [Gordonia polyisoprenivorans]|uniref:FMN-binding protein n=1 Tax=Gordonia polyisoprenivorans TaxID=84595 RepID=UPI001B8CB5D7|nr:FMN-binding protein [Gordonia polyisoprenivorans]QUD83771.1 FMN-binding protein [Gordonia polyisoprenivorans]